MDNQGKQSNEKTSTSEETLAGKLNDALNLQETPKYIGFGYKKYEVIKVIGSGRYSSVSLVSQDGKYKAYKEIDKGKLSGPFSRFSIEWILLRKMSHPHVIGWFGHFENLSTVGILLEYASCGSFTNLLQKRKGNGLTTESTWFYLFQMVTALSYLKDHAIAHRDLKSDNILIQSEVVLKLADFGDAIELGKPDGKVKGDVGTPAYKAPEVQKMLYGAKCDVFSLGIIIAEAVTGAAPGVDILERCRDKIRSEFVDILEKLLQKNPELRYSIDEIKEFFRKKFDRDAFKLVMDKAFADHGSPIPESEKIVTTELDLYDSVITHGRNLSIFQVSDETSLPAERVVIANKKLGEEPAHTTLKITNTSKDRCAFKVKCTSNELFRIRPPLGILQNGDSTSVALTFNGGKTVPESGKHYVTIYYIKVGDDKKTALQFWQDHKGEPTGSKRLYVDFKKEDATADGNINDKKEEKKDEGGDEKDEEKKDDDKKDDKKEDDKKDDDKKEDKKE